jgi:hypothetical protein
MWTFYNASGEALVQHAESEATQAELEAETAIAHFVPPDLVKNSPGAAKAWAQWTAVTTTAITGTAYNVSGVVDNAAGDTSLTFTIDMTSTNYSAVANCQNDGSGNGRVQSLYGMATGSIRFLAGNTANSTREDLSINAMACFGEQV